MWCLGAVNIHYSVYLAIHGIVINKQTNEQRADWSKCKPALDQWEGSLLQFWGRRTCPRGRSKKYGILSQHGGAGVPADWDKIQTFPEDALEGSPKHLIHPGFFGKCFSLTKLNLFVTGSFIQSRIATSWAVRWSGSDQIEFRPLLSLLTTFNQECSLQLDKGRRLLNKCIFWNILNYWPRCRDLNIL